MKILALITLLFVFSIPALAADVDGKWAGMVETPNGAVPVGFTFKADGEKLTGSTLGFDGMEIAISEGKVDGKTITFKINFDFGGMPFPVNYKGVVSPTEIKLTADFAGMPVELLLKKETTSPAAK